MFYGKIKEYYSQFDLKEQMIIDLLFEIRAEQIDEERSYIEEDADFIKINLVSEGDVCYPLSIWIGKADAKNKVYLLFGEDSSDGQIDILSYQDFSNDEGLSDVKVTISEVLKSHIRRKDILVNGELAKRVITSSAFQFGDGELIPFSRSFKQTWTWQQKDLSESEYQPWSP